jgi:GntP family gluconate:H+ symporter
LFNSAAPGAAAAAGIITVDLGKLMLIGTIAALPAMIAGHWWANFMGRKTGFIAAEEEVIEQSAHKPPSVIKAFLPVIVPIVLITTRSFLSIEGSVQGG